MCFFWAGDKSKKQNRALSDFGGEKCIWGGGNWIAQSEKYSCSRGTVLFSRKILMRTGHIK